MISAAVQLHTPPLTAIAIVAPGIEPIPERQVRLLLGRCKRLPKYRHQDGSVELLGKKNPAWHGFYYEYFFDAEGQERRGRRSIRIGRTTEYSRKAAKLVLRSFLDRTLDARGHIRTTQPIAATKRITPMTLEEFWSERYLPIAEEGWSVSTRRTNVSIVERHVLPALGAMPLEAIERFHVQVFLKGMASAMSESAYKKARVQLGAILSEAFEQDLIRKSPMSKIKTPKLRKPQRSYLSSEEIAAVTAQLTGRDRLLVRMFATLALRPSEMFALRWNDVLPNGYLMIDEAAPAGHIQDATKTEASCAAVWMPDSIQLELAWWRDAQANAQQPVGPLDFLFPTRRGTPMAPNNFLKRVIRAAAQRAYEVLDPADRNRGVLRDHAVRVNHRAFRRSCATLLQKSAGMKDIQAHLRHASPEMTMGTYVQEIPESVRAAVKALDKTLFIDLNNIEQKTRGGYEQ